MSWEELNTKGNKPKKLEPSEDDVIIFNAFTSKDGIKALDVLRKRTLNKPVLGSIGQDSGNTLLLMGMREGENNLVRWIEQTLKRISNRT